MGSEMDCEEDGVEVKVIMYTREWIMDIHHISESKYT